MPTPSRRVDILNRVERKANAVLLRRPDIKDSKILNAHCIALGMILPQHVCGLLFYGHEHKFEPFRNSWACDDAVVDDLTSVLAWLYILASFDDVRKLVRLEIDDERLVNFMMDLVWEFCKPSKYAASLYVEFEPFLVGQEHDVQGLTKPLGNSGMSALITMLIAKAMREDNKLSGAPSSDKIVMQLTFAKYYELAVTQYREKASRLIAELPG